MAQFVPRQAFPHYGAIPRSYFLGHHRAGLTKMKNMLSTIDYVVECRDSRAPVTSINPMFEEALGKTRRLIVYTKRDLSNTPQSPAQKLVSRIICNPRKVNRKLTLYRSGREEDPKLRSQKCHVLRQLILSRRRHPDRQTPPRRRRSS